MRRDRMKRSGKNGAQKLNRADRVGRIAGLPKVLFGFLPFVLLLCLASPSFAVGRSTALDAYVHARDSSYRYELIRQTKHSGYTMYLLQMTSQEWRTSSQVNRTLWQHWITIYRPKKVKGTTGMLLISGGSNNGRQPHADAMLASIATTSHTVVSEVADVPNQPLTFTNDSFGPRKEDEIIAYTETKYLETGDPTWLARFPMTNAAVKAMDTVTSFMATKQGGKLTVNKFVVAGASKRGWTTWTTAAVDSRVVAIVPMVIDVLNVMSQVTHQYRSYGFWSPALANYYNMGLLDPDKAPEMRKIMAQVDPYSYRDRYTMPKLLINAASGQYFLPDSSRYYFNDLPGEKYLRYFPNVNHSMKGSDVVENLTAFYLSVVDQTERPQFSWEFEGDGDIRVVTKTKPIEVKLWQATNPNHRDFRVDWVGPLYKSSLLAPTQPGVYLAHVAMPPKGWTAFFVELIYPGPKRKYPFHFTTAVRVIPDTEPFAAPAPGTKTILGTEPNRQQTAK